MTLAYNGLVYTVTDDSMYLDISIVTGSLEGACTIVNALADMTDYTFNGVEYSNMVVVKRSIILASDCRVKIALRQKSEKETVKEELNSLRTAMEELAQTTNKTTTAKINKILDKKGVQ